MQIRLPLAVRGLDDGVIAVITLLVELAVPLVTLIRRRPALEELVEKLRVGSHTSWTP